MAIVKTIPVCILVYKQRRFSIILERLFSFKFNLYPHMTVLKNLTLAPIKLHHKSRKEAEELAYHYLDITHEMGFARQAADRVIFMEDG